MAHVDIVDQTIRDGPQSLWGMRIRAGMVTKVAPQLRAAGFHTLDVPGGSFFTVMLRHLREDPVAAFAHIRGLLRGQTLRCGTRPSSTGRYGIASYASMDFYTEFMVQRLGIDAFWIYDCLYDMPEMERRARSVHQAGGAVVRPSCTGSHPCTPTRGTPRGCARWSGGGSRRRSTSRTRPASSPPSAVAR